MSAAEVKPMGWISCATYGWLKDPSGRGTGIFRPNRNGAYGGVRIYLGEDLEAMEALIAELLAALRTARTYMNTQGEQSRLDVAQVDAALAKVRA